MTVSGLRLRICDPLAEETRLLPLWSRVFGDSWPLRGEWFRAVLGGDRSDAILAECGGRPVGFALTRMGEPGSASGSLLALGVEPAFRRQGIGRALHGAALARLRDHGARTISLASGADTYFWPGIPADAPGTLEFFQSLGWQEQERSFDLTLDLTAYRTPTWVWERISRLRCVFATAAPGAASATASATGPATAESATAVPATAAFIAAEYPAWSAYFAQAFREGRLGDVLLAYSPEGKILSACLVESPTLRWSERFPGPVGAPGCLLVAETAREQGIGLATAARALEILRNRGCQTAFIGWTWLVEWYNKLGCQIWQEYILFAPLLERQS